jgi:hypothetical protein
LYSVDLWKIQTMMQRYASTAKLRDGGPFLTIGWKAMEVSGITATSDRYRRSVNVAIQRVEAGRLGIDDDFTHGGCEMTHSGSRELSVAR